MEAPSDSLNQVERIHHVFSEDLSKEASHDFSGAEKDLKEEITHMLYHLKDNSRYISMILSCESGDVFMNYFKEYLEKVFRIELSKVRTDVRAEYTKNYSLSDYAVRSSRSRQAVTKRVSDGALNIKELIDICDMTGYTLAVIDEKEDIIISFSSSDFDD